MNQRPPAHVGQLAKRGLPGPRGEDQLLRNEPATLMIATVRKDGADLIKHNIHVGLGTFIEVAHGLSSDAARLAPCGVMRTELNQT
jgi:hypothetical protein